MSPTATLIYQPTIIWDLNYKGFPLTYPIKPGNGEKFILPTPIHRWEVHQGVDITRHKIPLVDGEVATGYGKMGTEISLEGTIIAPDPRKEAGMAQGVEAWVLTQLANLKRALTGPLKQDLPFQGLPGYFSLYRYFGGEFHEVWNICHLASDGFREYRTDEFLFRLRWSAEIVSMEGV
jgi:hypothetical protein